MVLWARLSESLVVYLKVLPVIEVVSQTQTLDKALVVCMACSGSSLCQWLVLPIGRTDAPFQSFVVIVPSWISKTLVPILWINRTLYGFRQHHDCVAHDWRLVVRD